MISFNEYGYKYDKISDVINLTKNEIVTSLMVDIDT
jgi:hypothetical protein